MHRPSVGILALVLLATGTSLWAFGENTDTTAAWVAACWRIGLALAALWLALPDMRRVPVWLLAGLLFVALVVARNPRIMLIAVGAALAFTVLRPFVQRGMSGPR
ncbi:MAG: hypothetical protein KF708_05125 [Pirellulales bacterium]|nr:hypothetical protein [Pirellulales bacterium]